MPETATSTAMKCSYCDEVRTGVENVLACGHSVCGANTDCSNVTLVRKCRTCFIQEKEIPPAPLSGLCGKHGKQVYFVCKTKSCLSYLCLECTEEQSHLGHHYVNAVALEKLTEDVRTLEEAYEKVSQINDVALRTTMAAAINKSVETLKKLDRAKRMVEELQRARREGEGREGSVITPPSSSGSNKCPTRPASGTSRDQTDQNIKGGAGPDFAGPTQKNQDNETEEKKCVAKDEEKKKNNQKTNQNNREAFVLYLPPKTNRARGVPSKFK